MSDGIIEVNFERGRGDLARDEGRNECCAVTIGVACWGGMGAFGKSDDGRWAKAGSAGRNTSGHDFSSGNGFLLPLT